MGQPKGILLLLCIFLSFCIKVYGQENPVKGVVIFEKKFIASEAFESVNAFDVDGDGILDIFSGSFWYKGPGFSNRKFVGSIKRHGEYYEDFSTIIFDINRDGKPDVITGGWFEGTLVWRENSGGDEPWKEHIIARCGNIETTRAWDIDGDGLPEIVPNTPGKPLVIYKIRYNDSLVKFDSIVIFSKQGHGLGYGDLNGDGLGDFVLDRGWLECPDDPFGMPWIFHAEFNLVQASIPILVTDVNGDGIADLIVGQGHDYGLNWYEQRIDKKKKRTWIRHGIDPDNSQFHTMEWTDLDNDGQAELVTGKRYRAHDDKDPGARDPVGLYYFKWNGESFTKQIISFGLPGTGKGTGIFFAVTDLNNDNYKDIVVAGKDGLCVFFNKGLAK